MFQDSREEIREAVFDEVDRPETQAAFEGLRREHEALRRFDAAPALLEFLHAPDSTVAREKSEALHALVVAAGRPGQHSEKAKLLLLAGMWPALEHSYFRLRGGLAQADDPFAEIYWAFLEEVRRWNPQARNYVAFRLQRRLERRVHRALRRDLKYESVCREVIDSALALGEGRLGALVRHEYDASLSDVDRAEAVSVLDELVQGEVISTEEGLLILGHAIYGRPLKDLAVDLGIRYRAASKRFQRAARKVSAAIGRTTEKPRKECLPRRRPGLFSILDGGEAGPPGREERER